MSLNAGTTSTLNDAKSTGQYWITITQGNGYYKTFDPIAEQQQIEDGCW